MTTPEELAQEAKRLAVAYAEACAESAVDVGSARSHQWGAHLATPERALFASIDALAKRAEAAEALAEQYRKDAERYRWLRAHAYIELECDSPREPSWHPEQFDADIDTAIAKEGKSHE